MIDSITFGFLRDEAYKYLYSIEINCRLVVFSRREYNGVTERRVALTEWKEE